MGKPCPFCGEEFTLVEYKEETPRGHRTEFNRVCPGCGATAPWDDPDRRATPDCVKALLEKAEARLGREDRPLVTAVREYFSWPPGRRQP